jgi:hypothetical protein
LGVAFFELTNLTVILFVAFVFLLLVHFEFCREQQIRVIGLVLQLGGIFTVVRKLRATQDQFQLQTTSIWQWLKGFPQFPSAHVNLHASDFSVGGPVFSDARIRTSPGPATPLEQRVALLEQQFAGLFDEVWRAVGEIKANADKLSDSIGVERAERAKTDKRHELQLQQAVAGNLDLDYAGVLYFVLGTIASTASNEIARWLGASPCN